MANTLNLGTNGNWATKKESLLAYNSENNNFKPLPFNFERNSSATRVNKEGLIETVGSGIPRVDYSNDSNGALLLEPSRTNLILKSDDVLTTYQSQNGAVSDANTPINGFNNSIQIDYNASNSLIYKRDFTPTIGTEYTISCFVQMNDNSEPIHTVDVNSGDFCLINNNTLVSESDIKIERLGSTNVYKVSAKKTASDTNNRFGIIKYSTQSLKGFKVTGFQLEQGSYATSYIPTSGGVVTRSADNISFGFPDIASFNSSNGFSVVSKFYKSEAGTGSSSPFIYFGDDSSGTFIGFGSTNDKFRCRLNLNGTAYLNTQDNAPRTQNNNLFVSCDANGWSQGANGLTNDIGNNDASIFNKLSNISYVASEAYGIIKIREILVYNTRLSNAELQALTQV